MPSSFVHILSLLLASLVVVQVHTIPVPHGLGVRNNVSSHTVASTSLSDASEPVQSAVLTAHLERRALRNLMNILNRPGKSAQTPPSAPAPVVSPSSSSSPLPILPEVQTGPNLHDSVNSQLADQKLPTLVTPPSSRPPSPVKSTNGGSVAVAPGAPPSQSRPQSSAGGSSSGPPGPNSVPFPRVESPGSLNPVTPTNPQPPAIANPASPPSGPRGSVSTLSSDSLPPLSPAASSDSSFSSIPSLSTIHTSPTISSFEDAG